MQRLIAAKRVYASENTGAFCYVQLLDNFLYFEVNNIWTDTVGQNQFGAGGKISQSKLPTLLSNDAY